MSFIKLLTLAANFGGIVDEKDYDENKNKDK